MARSEDVQKAVREEIKKYLDRCHSAATPRVCAMIQQAEGYRKVERLIILKLIHDQLTIGAAIAQIEMEIL